MKTSIHLFALFVLAALAPLTPAWAAGHASGHVAELAFNKTTGNYLFIRLDSPNDVSGPSCSNNGYWQFLLTMQSTADKAMYAALLAAQLSGKVVQLSGTGNCNDVGSVESLSNLNTYQ